MWQKFMFLKMHQNFQLAYKIVKDEHKKINKKDKRKDKEDKQPSASNKSIHWDKH